MNLIVIRAILAIINQSQTIIGFICLFFLYSVKKKD
jgi:hypothetical protein